MELQDLKGIGKSRIAALHQAGIDTMADLLQTLPRSYRDTSRVTPIAQLSTGTPACVRGYLKGSPKLVYFHGKARVSATLQGPQGRGIEHFRGKFCFILSMIAPEVIWCTAANRLKCVSRNIIDNKIKHRIR